MESVRVDNQIGCMMEGDGSGDESNDDTAADLNTLNNMAASEACPERFFSLLHQMFMSWEEGSSVPSCQ